MNHRIHSSDFRRIAGLIVLIAVLLGLFFPRVHIGFAALFDRTAELTEELEFKEPANGLSSIELQAAKANGGQIDVKSTDGEEIIIRATHLVRATDEGKGKAYLEEITTDVRSQSGRLVVESKLPERKTGFFNRRRPDYIRHESVSYQVWIPMESGIRELRADTDDGDINVDGPQLDDSRLRNDDGNITVINSSGKVVAHSDDGDIRVSDSEITEATLSTDDGDIVVVDAHGKIDVRTDDGDISLVRCSGSLQCGTDDSNISLEECSGRFRAETDDGEVKILGGLFDSIEFTTDDGNFEFDAEGTGDTTFKANSDSGRIRIQSTAVGTANLSSDSGNITAAFGSVESKVTMHTDDGRIDLILSKKQPFSLDATFEKGRMRNEFKLENENRKEEQLTGIHLGGGPQIKLSANDGTIRLSVAQATP